MFFFSRIGWQGVLDEGEVKSLSHIAKTEGLTRARVTQIMNLLKLSANVKRFLASLQDPMEIQRAKQRSKNHKPKNMCRRC
jgi:hypothetical protein